MLVLGVVPGQPWLVVESLRGSWVEFHQLGVQAAPVVSHFLGQRFLGAIPIPGPAILGQPLNGVVDAVCFGRLLQREPDA